MTMKLPSTDTLAIVTAIMGKGPEAAIQLWRDCDWTLGAWREFPDGIGGKKTEKEAMELLGIRSAKTFHKLLRACFPKLSDADFEKKLDAARRKGFPVEMIGPLQETQHARNVERGRINRLNASKKRKRQKPSN